MQEVARLIRHFRFGDQQPDEPSLAGALPLTQPVVGTVGAFLPSDPSRRCIVRTLPPLPLSFLADLDNPIVARIMSNNTQVSEQNNKVDQPIPLRV